MKINIVAVGLMKESPEKQLIDYYLKQCGKNFQILITEINPKKALSKEDEADLINQKIDPSSCIIALDEKGDNISTHDLLSIMNKQYEAYGKITFIIGGADGLSQKIRTKANKILSFGMLTWPHMLVRVMLVEQLYRCQQIAANHPYHRV